MCVFMQALVEGGKQLENGGDVTFYLRYVHICHNEAANYSDSVVNKANHMNVQSYWYPS